MWEDIKRNWKTTAVGAFVFVIVVFYLAQKLIRNEPIDLQAVIAMVVGGAVSVGFFSAKDGNVTGGTRPATPEAAERIGVPLPSEKTPPAALALLVLVALGTGCAAMKGGTTATVTTGPLGTSGCVSFAPPISVSGMSCTGVCSALDADKKLTWQLSCVPSGTTQAKALVLKEATP
jgi:hypothetical protein